MAEPLCYYITMYLFLSSMLSYQLASSQPIQVDVYIWDPDHVPQPIIVNPTIPDKPDISTNDKNNIIKSIKTTIYPRNELLDDNYKPQTKDTISKQNMAIEYEIEWKFANERKGLTFFYRKNEEGLDYAEWWVNFRDYYPKYGEKRFLDKVNRCPCVVSVYRNCYAANNAEFNNGTHMITPPFFTGPMWIRQNHGAPGPVVAQLDWVFACGHGGLQFGHFIVDYLTPMMLVPEEIISKCTLILVPYLDFVVDFCIALGIKRDKMIILKSNQWVFAKNLVVHTAPRPHYGHFGPPMQVLKDKIRKFFNLTNIIPTKYVLQNRVNSRPMLNFKEITDVIKKNYPNINWEIIMDAKLPIADYARIYSQFKLLFNPSGSNMFKAIFMADETVIVDANTDLPDIANWYTHSSWGINLVLYLHPHGSFKRQYGDVELTIKAVGVALTKLQTGKWPKPVENESFIDYYK